MEKCVRHMAGNRGLNYALIALFIFFTGTSLLPAQELLDCFNGNMLDDQCRRMLLDKARNKAFPLTTNDTAYFIWTGRADSVFMVGDHTRWRLDDDHLFVKVAPDIFIYKKAFAANARFDYKIVADGNWMLDPVNPRTIMGGFGLNSACRMPAFTVSQFVERQLQRPSGHLDTLQVASTEMDTFLNVVIYTPPQFDPSSTTKYPAAYFNDGPDYIRLGNAHTILDNLIYTGAIEPLIGVFIQPNDRNAAYAYGLRHAYAAFVANELLPMLEARYPLKKSASERAVIGTSFGANIAVIIVKHHASFEKLGLHSPALYPNDGEAYNWLYNEAENNLRIAIIRGTMERGVNLQATTVLNHLNERGVDALDKTYPDGHSWGLWKNTLAEMLQFLFAN